MSLDPRIAYFSMEIGLESGMPTYSGGLGILAGDTIRAAADTNLEMVAVTLLDREGYFYQKLTPKGKQIEEPVEWQVDDYMTEMPQRTSIVLEGRIVSLRCWKYEVKGVTGGTVEVYFLDSDLPENAPQDRSLTDRLYGGDEYYRLCQEAILGIGGVRVLRELGFHQLEKFHMNEGHSSLLALELLEEEARKAGRETITEQDVESVRKKCVFTTHTPVPSGQDQFSMELVSRVLGEHQAFEMKDVFCCEGRLNMTFLGFNLSHYINGVAKKHGEVSQMTFARYKIEAITNGVHAATWTSPAFQSLYDRYIPGWRQDNFSLRYALSIPRQEIWQAHTASKKTLLEYVNEETNAGLDLHVFTIGFARRATAYKRTDLLLQNPGYIKSIFETSGQFQIIYAGKAHPTDVEGKALIERIFQRKADLADRIKIVYLANYDIDLAKRITSGVDLWLNTPQPPLEASGTSGMKAALNGVPSLSILDGWWIEGCIEGITGWAIGENGRLQETSDSSRDANSLYQKLEYNILPMFYKNRHEYLNVMMHAIALNGSFFNTQRMLQQYLSNAYFH